MSYKSFSTAQDAPVKSDDKSKAAPATALPANQVGQPAAGIKPAAKP